MSNPYELFIHDILAEECPGVRPRIRVARQTLDLRSRGAFPEHYLSGDSDLPAGLLARLIEESRSPRELASSFTLNPHVDQARATALELRAEHYSPLPTAHDAIIEFEFSPVVTSETDGVSLFYAEFYRGALWAGGFLCLATPGEVSPTVRKSCLWRS